MKFTLKGFKFSMTLIDIDDIFKLQSLIDIVIRSFRLLSSHLDQGDLLASARMTSPVIG